MLPHQRRGRPDQPVDEHAQQEEDSHGGKEITVAPLVDVVPGLADVVYAGGGAERQKRRGQVWKQAQHRTTSHEARLLWEDQCQVHNGSSREGYSRAPEDDQPVRSADVEDAAHHQRNGGAQAGEDLPGLAPTPHPVNPDANTQVGQPDQVGDNKNQ